MPLNEVNIGVKIKSLKLIENLEKIENKKQLIILIYSSIS